MPIYDYVCEACGTKVEVIHSISASGPAACAVCGGSMRKALTAPAIVFKGSGWAKKDFRDSQRAKSPSTGDAASGTGTDAATASSESGSTTPAPATTPSSTAPAAASTSTTAAPASAPAAAPPKASATAGGSSGSSGSTAG